MKAKMKRSIEAAEATEAAEAASRMLGGLSHRSTSGGG